jgi:hypothetical protein
MLKRLLFAFVIIVMAFTYTTPVSAQQQDQDCLASVSYTGLDIKLTISYYGPKLPAGWRIYLRDNEGHYRNAGDGLTFQIPTSPVLNAKGNWLLIRPEAYFARWALYPTGGKPLNPRSKIDVAMHLVQGETVRAEKLEVWVVSEDGKITSSQCNVDYVASQLI